MIPIVRDAARQTIRFRAGNSRHEDIRRSVDEILTAVRERGDSAVREYSQRFDGACPEDFELDRKCLEEAAQAVPASLLETLRTAADNIRRYHSAQVRRGFTLNGEGTMLMERIVPLENVGVYVPGGTAAYPSSVLMNVIPAKIAGVDEVIMASPPTCNGTVSPIILAAAYIAGVDRVFQVGGAQAIAAMAYGTESIPAVCKIIGPGNAYVAEAKRQVYGQVGIELIGGPSEILIVADEANRPEVLAADMLAQAEHDTMATAVLITTSEELAEGVAAEIEKQLTTLPREEIARASINNNGMILLVGSLQEGLALANRMAPELLGLYVKDPFNYISSIRSAGSVFLGGSCPEALGDYFSGTNHTLPTGGSARYGSPLSVDDFIKKISFTYYSSDALESVKDGLAELARAEGLEGHARSVLIRSSIG